MVNKKKKKKDTEVNKYNDGKTKQNKNEFLREKKSGRSSFVDDLYSMPPSLVTMHVPQLPSFCEISMPPLNLLSFEYFCNKCMFFSFYWCYNKHVIVFETLNLTEGSTLFTCPLFPPPFTPFLLEQNLKIKVVTHFLKLSNFENMKCNLKLFWNLPWN